jgi:hypothetical protein
MRIPSSLTAALLVGITCALAPSLPQESDVASTGAIIIPSDDPNIALQQLDQILQSAIDTTNEIVESGNLQKRGTCTVQNLVIRREW